MNRQFESIRQTTANFGELLETIAQEYQDELADSSELVDVMLNNKTTESVSEVFEGADYSRLEAIVMATMRPAYFIKQDKIELKQTKVWV